MVFSAWSSNLCFSRNMIHPVDVHDTTINSKRDQTVENSKYRFGRNGLLVAFFLQSFCICPCWMATITRNHEQFFTKSIFTLSIVDSASMHNVDIATFNLWKWSVARTTIYDVPVHFTKPLTVPRPISRKFWVKRTFGGHPFSAILLLAIFGGGKYQKSKQGVGTKKCTLANWEKWRYVTWRCYIVYQPSWKTTKRDWDVFQMHYRLILSLTDPISHPYSWV